MLWLLWKMLLKSFICHLISWPFFQKLHPHRFGLMLLSWSSWKPSQVNPALAWSLPPTIKKVWDGSHCRGIWVTEPFTQRWLGKGIVAQIWVLRRRKPTHRKSFAHKAARRDWSQTAGAPSKCSKALWLMHPYMSRTSALQLHFAPVVFGIIIGNIVTFIFILIICIQLEDDMG